ICTKAAAVNRSKRHTGRHAAPSKDRDSLARARTRFSSGLCHVARKGVQRSAADLVHDGTFCAFGARSRALTCKTRLPQQTPFLVQSRFGTFPFLDTSPSPLHFPQSPSSHLRFFAP